MDNPIEAFEHLPKNKKLIVVGGAIGLAGILAYSAHKKSQAATAASGADENGAASSGTQDGTTSTDQYTDPGNDEGMLPYGGENPADFFGGGGMGSTSGGGGFQPDIATTGAGDLGNSTQVSLPDNFGTDLGTGIATGLAAAGVTGGGAPHTDPTKHMAHKTPTKQNAKPKPKPKPKPKAKPKPKPKPKAKPKPKPKPRPHRGP